jgi:hypothetical protein
MSASALPQQRKVFRRIPIVAGNALQLGGIVAAGLALASARSIHSTATAAIEMIVAWVCLYFCCHGIAHWVVGRLLGIRFAFYTIGGTGNPGGYPAGLRWLFEHLPFFGVQTERASMQRASPLAKAVMWSAGVTSSAVLPASGALCAWREGITGSTPLLFFAIFWSIGTLASNWRSSTGDFSKARRALAASSK